MRRRGDVDVPSDYGGETGAAEEVVAEPGVLHAR